MKRLIAILLFGCLLLCGCQVVFAKAEIPGDGLPAILDTSSSASTLPAIKITGLNKPVVGEIPDRTAGVDNDIYRIAEIIWAKYIKDKRLGYTWQTMEDDAKFAEKGIYRCRFVVELSGGLRLPNSLAGLTASVKGRPAVIGPTTQRQIAVDMYYYFSEEGKLLGNYIVTFDANGGGGSMNRTFAFAGDYFMLPMCTLTPPDGKSFKTWSVEGKEIKPGEEMDPGYVIWMCCDIKLTAVWAVHTCTPKEVARVEPSCVAEGKQAYYRCDSCGKAYEDANGTRSISNLAAWGILARNDTHTDGDGDGKCDACGYEKHICTLEGIAKVEPSCLAEGKEAYYRCYGCGKAYADGEATKRIYDVEAWGVLAKTEHTPSDWALDNKYHWKRCATAGCGVTIEGSRQAHSDGDGDGKCDACDHKMRKVVQNVGSAGDGASGAPNEPAAPTEPANVGSVDPVPTGPAAAEGSGEGDNGLWWLWLLAVPVAAAGGIAALVLWKKKKQP